MFCLLEVEDSDMEDIISDEEYHPKERQHRRSKNSIMLNSEDSDDENGLDCLDDPKSNTDPTNHADERRDNEGIYYLNAHLNNNHDSSELIIEDIKPLSLYLEAILLISIFPNLLFGMFA